MNWLLLAGAAVILLFASALLFGAPFLPTLRARTNEALDLLDLESGQTLLELGSGDGRILRAAAQRGIRSIGYEINPLLVLYSKVVGWEYRRLSRVYWRNYWRQPLPRADGIYVFLLNPYMAKLDTKITQEITRPTRVVSFAFAFPGRTSSQQKNGLMRYQFKPRDDSSEPNS